LTVLHSVSKRNIKASLAFYAYIYIYLTTEANLQLPAPFEDEDALIDKFATVDLEKAETKK